MGVPPGGGGDRRAGTQEKKEWEVTGK